MDCNGSVYSSVYLYYKTELLLTDEPQAMLIHWFHSLLSLWCVIFSAQRERMREREQYWGSTCM